LGVGGAPVPDFLINHAEKNDEWRNEKKISQLKTILHLLNNKIIKYTTYKDCY
jgi:hypothetical protein